MGGLAFLTLRNDDDSHTPIAVNTEKFVYLETMKSKRTALHLDSTKEPVIIIAESFDEAVELIEKARNNTP